jgi:hypothetical protein
VRLTRTAVVAVVLVTAAAACGGGSGSDDDAAPAATLGTTPSSTTSTTLSVEAEVEAAYLKSWDVFATAAYDLETDGLESAYSGPALEVVTKNIERYITNNTPVRFRADHDFDIEVKDDLAQVRDTYVNHGVLLDAQTMQPTEPDPNETLTEIYLMQRIDGAWKVIDISRA